MNLCRTIFVLLAFIASVACQGSSHQKRDGVVVASVGDKMLTTSEISQHIPEGSSLEDSVVYTSRYAQDWVVECVKLAEAERVFSQEIEEIEDMVDEYRTSLLVKRLNQHRLRTEFTPTESQSQVEEFYAENGEIFKSERSMVKGRIVRFKSDYEDHEKVAELMGSSKSADSVEFAKICTRADFQLNEFKNTWVNYDDFLDCLPAIRGERNSYMTTRGVQTLIGGTEGEYRYLFEITGYVNSGYKEPLSRVEQRILQILNTREQLEFLQSEDMELLEEAKSKGLIDIKIDTLTIN